MERLRSQRSHAFASAAAAAPPAPAPLSFKITTRLHTLCFLHSPPQLPICRCQTSRCPFPRCRTNYPPPPPSPSFSSSSSNASPTHCLTSPASMSHRSSSPYLFEINVRQWVRSEQARRAAPVMVTEPREVAVFSKDCDGRVVFGSRHHLRPFSPPPPNADLNHGFDTFVPKRHDDTCVSTVINATRAQDPHAFAECDIVTYRNNLNKISRTPVADRDEWELDCCQFADNKVALDIRMTEQQAPQQQAGDDPARALGTFHGYKFEALCTSADPSAPIDPNSEFCSIALVKLARHRMIVSSEIDATFGNPMNSPSPIKDYVELKTIKSIRHDGDLSSLYRFRYPKFWFQSFIAGVPNIVIGYRAPNGVLTHTSTISTFDMPAEAEDFFHKQGQRCWNPTVMLNFTDHLLSLIRQVCSANPGFTIRVFYNPVDSCVRAFMNDRPDAGLSVRLAQKMSTNEPRLRHENEQR